MKVYWIVLCRNEADVIPYCLEYWKRIADKVIVYDNGSEDGSIEMLSNHDWIEIRHFESDGQNDIIQKQVKEQAYLEFKDRCDIMIISDMDEVFWFENDKQKEMLFDVMLKGNYDVMTAELFALCEDSKPVAEDGKLLHQLCHKFYKQKLNHMKGFEGFSKLSIFNTHTVEQVNMSVGQHYVQTLPNMNILWTVTPRCLHMNKGFGIDYKYAIRQKMNKNLSETNKRSGMGIEYADSYEKLKKEYEENQSKSFDINKKATF